MAMALSNSGMSWKFKLNTGTEVPGLGFGSGTPAPVEEIKAAVLEAIKLGYRHFDTAQLYGTEQAIGQALAEAFESGLVEREHVFITTKLRNDDHDFVVESLRKSLRDLQVKYVDLFLIHGPVRTRKGALFPPREDDFLPLDIPCTWKGMEDCFHLKLTKAIGVSNFSTKKLQDLLSHATISPAANQVELHPVWQQNKLREFCKLHGIQLFAWSPLGGRGKFWGSDAVLNNPIIQELAVKHQRTPAQVILRWMVGIGVVPVVKSYSSKRLSENLDSSDFELTREDYSRIETISQRRLAWWEEMCNSSTSPYKSAAELWDDEI